MILRVGILALLVGSFATAADEDDPFADCMGCHSYIVEKPVVHQAALLGCKICHAPHGQETDQPHRLKQQVNYLCLGCHEDYAPRYCETKYGRRLCGHPVYGHPLDGPKDPVYPDKDFNCASCHNAHSSTMEHLFRYPFGKSTSFNGPGCIVCHWDDVWGPGPAPAKPPRSDGSP